MMIHTTRKNFIFRKCTLFLSVGIALLMLISVGSVFSQDMEEPVVADAALRLGAHIGITQGTFAKNNQNFTDPKVGVLIGAFAHYKPDFLPSWLTLNGELNYQQQGAANIEVPSNDPNITKTKNIIQHYISIPVMGIVTPPGILNESLIPYIGAGVAWGYNMKTYQQTTTSTDVDGGTSFRVESYTDKSRQYLQNDFAAVLAAGLLIKTETWLYTVEGRYRLGLTNLNNISTNSANTFTGNVFTIKVGVGFLKLF